MWDLKLFFFEIENFLMDFLTSFFYNILNLLTVYEFNGFTLFYNKFTFVINSSLIFGLKFLIIIAFLILIRGGTPRYRYDYLTKLGWLKFIGLIVLFFFLSLFTFYIY